MKERFKILKAIGSGINRLRLIIINIVFFYLLILVFAAISSGAKTGEKHVVLNSDSVLLVQPVGVIVENADDHALPQQLMMQGEKITSVSDIVAAILAAAHDRHIRSIVFDFSKSRMSLSSAYEIKAALDVFKQSGNPYYAFSTAYRLPSYFAASSAERVGLDVFGDADFSGLASEGMFFGGMHEKTGIQYFVSKAGTYKGAADTYTEKAFTKEVRENYESMFGDTWAYFVKACAENRGISESALLEYAESPLAILKKHNGKAATALQDLNVVTDVATFSDFLQSLSISESNLVSYKDFATTLKHGHSRNTVCIINLDGAITSNDLGFSGRNAAEDWRLVNKFEEACGDPSTRAIIMRVNSGGGEVFASEVIRRALEKSRKQYNIPVIVSMADVAASGAYWISSNADYIFATPFTITGSIGVLSSLPNLKDALQKYLGISTDLVYKGAKPLSVLEPPTATDMEIMQLQVSGIYDAFLQTVSTGRKMPKEAVAKLASGKVYSGNQALQLGLVDKLGTLQDAISYAADLCDLGNDYTVKTITEKKTFWEEFLLTVTKNGVTISQMPLLKSFVEISALARTNKFLLYEPLMFTVY